MIKSRRLRWVGHVAPTGWMRYAYKILVMKPEGMRPLGEPRGRWENNIKMYLREIGWKVFEWIRLAQDKDQWRAHVNMNLNLRVP
jgi:hypothetical protein